MWSSPWPTAHTRTGCSEYCGKSIQSAVNLGCRLPPHSLTHTHTHPPQRLNCSLRDDRGEAAVAAVVGGCRARGTPYNGACCWPAFRWNWIGNLPRLVSITKGLVALDKGCFSNAQNQSLYGLGALFPPAIQVFLQWSLIKSVKTKLRVISAPPQLLLQGRKRERDQTLRMANSWVRVCIGCRMHSAPSHAMVCRC